ncbi:MAG: hypothetical protein ACUVS3_05420 [Thermodesulfobacteriota bacterium]
MMERVREEIANIQSSARRLAEISHDFPALRRNAEIILVFADLLDFITPPIQEVQDGTDPEDPHRMP